MSIGEEHHGMKEDATVSNERPTPMQLVNDLEELLERNAMQRRELVKQAQMAFEEGSKVQEIASRLVEQHGDKANEGKGLCL